MTFARESFGWDARLQAFLPKFLNVSSYAIALPFGLWAMASALRDERRSSRAIAAIVPLALSIALNPIVGGFAAIVIAVWVAPTLARGRVRERAAWPHAGRGGRARAAFLSALRPAARGPSLTDGWRARRSSEQSPRAAGSLDAALSVRARSGERALVPDRRGRIAAALVLSARCRGQRNYKMERLRVVLAAGFWAARAHARGVARAPPGRGVACVPTTLACRGPTRVRIPRGEPAARRARNLRCAPRSARALAPAILAAERAPTERARDAARRTRLALPPGPARQRARAACTSAVRRRAADPQRAHRGSRREPSSSRAQRRESFDRYAIRRDPAGSAGSAAYSPSAAAHLLARGPGFRDASASRDESRADGYACGRPRCVVDGR